jgi:NAD(P)-dependent dehydrogenase (short-subunit alcohol dehydrogenase family)
VEIRGTTAIVTGAARGIGLAVGRRLADEGASILVVDVDETNGERAARELAQRGGEARFLTADVTDPAEVEAMVSQAVEAFGGLEVLVNNAGGYEEPVFPDAPPEHWSRTLDLNLRSVMLGIQFAIPVMTSGGAVVNIGSSAGLPGSPHPGPDYAIAKAGVMRLTECMAPLAERGIRVNCVCPHTVATEAVLETIAALEAKGAELPGPLRDEPIPPERVADAVVRFVEDESMAGRILVLRGANEAELLPFSL